jgi:hypothetical protein
MELASAEGGNQEKNAMRRCRRDRTTKLTFDHFRHSNPRAEVEALKLHCFRAMFFNAVTADSETGKAMSFEMEASLGRAGRAGVAEGGGILAFAASDTSR